METQTAMFLIQPIDLIIGFSAEPCLYNNPNKLNKKSRYRIFIYEKLGNFYDISAKIIANS